MTRKVLGEILTRHAKCKAEKDVFVPEEGTVLDVYASVGNSLITLKAASKVTLEGEVAVVESREGAFILAYEDLRALRCASKNSRLGYGA